jgi:hypothetical protein
MTDAEATVKFAILNGIIDQWHKKGDPQFAEIIRDKVFENLFAPHLKWAVEEYLEQLNRVTP